MDLSPLSVLLIGINSCIATFGVGVILYSKIVAWFGQIAG